MFSIFYCDRSKFLELSLILTDNQIYYDAEEFTNVDDLIKSANNFHFDNGKKLVILSNNGVEEFLFLNKNKNIISALVLDSYSAYYSPLHNAANIIIIPLDFILNTQAISFINIFINTHYEGGRHDARVRMLTNKA